MSSAVTNYVHGTEDAGDDGGEGGGFLMVWIWRRGWGGGGVKDVYGF